MQMLASTVKVCAVLVSSALLYPRSVLVTQFSLSFLHVFCIEIMLTRLKSSARIASAV